MFLILLVAHTTIMDYDGGMFDRCLYFNVNALARIVNKQWTKAFSEFELSPAHAYMLRVVLSHPGITQKQLASELKLEKSTITRFIDALSLRGLVIRKTTGIDGREQNIYPTKEATKIHKLLEQKGDELYKQMIDSIGHGQLTALVKKLKQSENSLKL